jgi:hypothetical protein
LPFFRDAAALAGDFLRARIVIAALSRAFSGTRSRVSAICFFPFTLNYHTPLFYESIDKSLPLGYRPAVHKKRVARLHAVSVTTEKNCSGIRRLLRVIQAGATLVPFPSPIPSSDERFPQDLFKVAWWVSVVFRNQVLRTHKFRSQLAAAIALDPLFALLVRPQFHGRRHITYRTHVLFLTCALLLTVPAQAQDDGFSPAVTAAIKKAWVKARWGSDEREFGFVAYTDGTVTPISMSDSPRRFSFRVDKSKAVLATFHTHPNSAPQGLSIDDEDVAAKTGICIYVISRAGVDGRLARSASCRGPQ